MGWYDDNWCMMHVMRVCWESVTCLVSHDMTNARDTWHHVAGSHVTLSQYRYKSEEKKLISNHTVQLSRPPTRLFCSLFCWNISWLDLVIVPAIFFLSSSSSSWVLIVATLSSAHQSICPPDRSQPTAAKYHWHERHGRQGGPVAKQIIIALKY